MSASPESLLGEVEVLSFLVAGNRGASEGSAAVLQVLNQVVVQLKAERPGAAVLQMQEPRFILDLLRPQEPRLGSLGYLVPVAAAWVFFLLAGEFTLDASEGHWILASWASYVPAGMAPFAAWVLVWFIAGLTLQGLWNRFRQSKYRKWLRQVLLQTQAVAVQAGELARRQKAQDNSEEGVKRIARAAEKIEALLSSLDQELVQDLAQVGGDIQQATEATQAAAGDLTSAAQAISSVTKHLSASTATWAESSGHADAALEGLDGKLGELQAQLSSIPTAESLSEVLATINALIQRDESMSAERTKQAHHLAAATQKLGSSAQQLAEATRQYSTFLAYADALVKDEIVHG